MTVRVIALAAFVVVVLAGFLIDSRPSPAPSLKTGYRGATVLVADLHVHAAPGDGLLTVWEIQREAARRDVDVVAITNHNQNVAPRLAAALGKVDAYPMMIPGQELTTPTFHIAAIGVSEMIDWRLPARDAIAAIHAQGGVAIAAHPVRESWLDTDPDALRGLDGAEVSHPLVLGNAASAAGLMEFFERARALNPRLAPIGSTDFHGSNPLGLCRTYLLVEEVSRAGVLDAIRQGRTVASGPGDRLVGNAEHVAAVRGHLRPPQPSGFGRGGASQVALAALFSLAVVVLFDRRPSEKVATGINNLAKS